MAAELGGWWPMSPWLSPGAAWFIFFNVVVGAIAVMSRANDSPASRRRLSRTASTLVLDSLRSISLFSFPSGVAGGDDSVLYYSPPASQQLHHVHQDQGCAFQEPEAREAISCRVAPPELREPEPAVAAAAAVAECEDEDGESISLDEAYALARTRREPAAAAAAAAANNTVAKEVPRKKREPVKLAEVKAYACGRGVLEEVQGKAEVNTRAEQFIRQFREELKLERINSILNYTRALRRGGATVAPGAATNRLV